jgi:predicted RNase H-like HicB family nuclease
MHVQEEVLEAAQRIAAGRKDWSFTVREIVEALPSLNSSTVRTHVVSRCCVNAPKNHPHKWDYFRRIGRGLYQLEAKYRRNPPKRESATTPMGKQRLKGKAGSTLRKNLHAVIQEEGQMYTVECLELPVVTQGRSLDEAVQNFREALALHLEGEDLTALGILPNPDIQISYEMSAA